MPLWDVRVERIQELTVTVEGRTTQEAKARAMHPTLWLDETHGPIVHVEPFEAHQRGGYDEEPDAMTDWKHLVENLEE